MNASSHLSNRLINTPTSAVADLCSVLLHNSSASSKDLGPAALRASRSAHSAVKELNPLSILSGVKTRDNSSFLEGEAAHEKRTVIILQLSCHGIYP
jgi:hypothetical protein